jgi:hypothetical protein
MIADLVYAVTLTVSIFSVLWLGKVAVRETTRRSYARAARPVALCVHHPDGTSSMLHAASAGEGYRMARAVAEREGRPHQIYGAESVARRAIPRGTATPVHEDDCCDCTRIGRCGTRPAAPQRVPIVPAPLPLPGRRLSVDEILARDPEIAALRAQIADTDGEIADLRAERARRTARRRWFGLSRQDEDEPPPGLRYL